MGDTEDVNIDMMQRLQSSFGTSSSSFPKKPISINHLDVPQLNNSQNHTPIRQFSPNYSGDSSKRVGIPPSHPQIPPISPYSQIRAAANQQLGCNSLRTGDSLPPRKAHRRSNSDIPFGFSSSLMQSSPPFLPLRGDNSGAHNQVQLIKPETNWDKGGEGEVVDDLFSAYMNLENIDTLNSSGTDDKPCNESRDDLDSRASGSKTNGGDSSDNETTSSVDESGNSLQRSRIGDKRGEGNKRNAGVDIAPTTRHYRSISMDSFMGKMNFGDDSPKLPPSPMEFGNGEFSGAELKKIMANEKLAEIAMADPKRAKRILANRQSAARSKERKMRYIAELEHKVQTLQTEATTLSAQLTLLQRDSAGLNNQNNELKFRLQAMEQQAQLRDALNEALSAEVHRLKLATADELSGESSKFQQLSLNPQMFQLHQHQHGSSTTKHDSNE